MKAFSADELIKVIEACKRSDVKNLKIGQVAIEFALKPEEPAWTPEQPTSGVVKIKGPKEVVEEPELTKEEMQQLDQEIEDSLLILEDPTEWMNREMGKELN